MHFLSLQCALFLSTVDGSCLPVALEVPLCLLHQKKKKSEFHEQSFDQVFCATEAVLIPLVETPLRFFWPGASTASSPVCVDALVLTEGATVGSPDPGTVLLMSSFVSSHRGENTEGPEEQSGVWRKETP